jgi:hypothetical protein
MNRPQYEPDALAIFRRVFQADGALLAYGAAGGLHPHPQEQLCVAAGRFSVLH